MRVRVIGIGTPHGDDAAGLWVAARLQETPSPRDASVTTCQRPGLDLPEALTGADAAVLVDAMRTGAAPGHVRRVELAELPALRALSSHGLGLAEGLALARALGRLPAKIALVGIEGVATTGDRPTPAVCDGVEVAADLVRRLLRDQLR